MGLLDDAIREHLDLKRARGGDPAEIERMEREALGPVRREPTIGSTRFEDDDDRRAGAAGRMAAEPEYHEDHLEDLEELQERGYHDSTAPHPHHHAHHRHDDRHAEFEEPHFGHEHDDFEAEQEEPEQPRRRFLRRNRGSAPAESAPDAVGFHEADSEFDHYDPLDHRDHLEEHGQVDHDERFEEHEGPFDEYDEPDQDHAPGASTPPSLQFEHPPKRPRFTAEPPSLEPSSDDEPGADEPEALPPGAQETTEFDVQKHIAETRHLPDEDVAAEKRPPARGKVAPADADTHGDDEPWADEADADEAGTDEQAPVEEDVLEETPEFLQDTPEHDRLWFEQRPPKDFDFDG